MRSQLIETMAVLLGCSRWLGDGFKMMAGV